MRRNTRLAALVVILATLYGCDANWTPSGSAATVVGFGHPDGSNADTHPMEEAVYGAGSTILIEYHTAATFGGDADTESIAYLARQGIIRDRKSGKIWNGSEWMEDETGSLCELALPACVQVKSEDQIFCLDSSSLAADALGNCDCEIEISACNTGTFFGDPKDTITTTTRRFTIDLGHPITEITVPAQDALVDAPFAISGTAARGSTAVELTIEDRDSGRFWDPETGFMNATGPDSIAIDVAPADQSWQYDFDESTKRGSGNYRVTAVARARDGSNDSSPAVTDFSVSGSLPGVEILQPAQGHKFSTDELPVTIAGRAANDGIVARVDIRIADVNTGEIWNESTASFEQPDSSNPDQGWITLQPESPGGTFDWSYRWNDIESGTGQYVVAVRADNAVGQSTPEPWPSVQFFGPTDTQPASAIMNLPQPGQVLDRVDQLANGVATDAHSGVARVAVEILDHDKAGRYWGVQGSRTGWYGVPIAGPIPTFDAELDPAADGNSVNWTARLWNPQIAKTQGGSGSYRIRVLVYDAQGNRHQSRYVDFSVDNSVIPDS